MRAIAVTLHSKNIHLFDVLFITFDLWQNSVDK